MGAGEAEDKTAAGGNRPGGCLRVHVGLLQRTPYLQSAGLPGVPETPPGEWSEKCLICKTHETPFGYLAQMAAFNSVY